MPGLEAGRPPIVRALGACLIVVGTVVGLLAAMEISLYATVWSYPAYLVLPVPLSALVFLAAGLVAWWQRPSNRTGAIMIWGAVLLLLAGLDSTGVTWLTGIAVVLATAVLPLLVHLLLAFPSGRLRGAMPRWTVLAGYGVSSVLQVPLYLLNPAASPGGVLAVGSFPGALRVAIWVQSACGLAVMVVTAVILASRFRRAGQRERRVMGPLYLYGIAAVLAVPVIPSVIRPLTGMSAEMSSLLQFAVITLVPVTVGCAMLFGGFARTSEVQELGTWLVAAGERPAVRDALARALGDPAVRLSFWAPESGTYVDQGGRPVLVPDPGSGLAAAEIGLDGRRVAAIEYDPRVVDDPELVVSAGRVVMLALDRDRLTAELLASRRDLEQSRARIVQAGDRARRRIAQDLHDGLQADLVLLGVQAQDVGDIPGATADVAAAATRLRVRIDSAARSLRELVYTVMPPPLTQGGLIPAVEDLVDRMRVPTELEVDDAADLPVEVQSTAYFVVAEGLSNAVKHANATRIAVRLAHGDGRLTVEVSDDGNGAAAIGAGRGLRGLTDRVHALGGHMTVHSAAGQGTRLVAEMPCEC